MALIRGTIYKLSDDEGYFYFGSTTRSLRDRFMSHKSDSKHAKRKTYEQFTYEKFCQKKIIIEVVEEVVVENEIELRKIENIYITRYRNDMKLLNEIKSYSSEEEKKEYKKQYNQQEKYRNYKLKYNNDNREAKNEKQRNYRTDHIEEIKRKGKETIICECGSQVTKINLKRHNKSQFHQDFIANNN